MIATMFMGLFTALPIFLVVLYGMNDLNAVIDSPLPSLEIMLQV